MILTYELDLDILKMHLRTKMKFLGQGFQKLEHERDGETHRQTRPSTYHTAFAGVMKYRLNRLLLSNYTRSRQNTGMTKCTR